MTTNIDEIVTEPTEQPKEETPVLTINFAGGIIHLTNKEDLLNIRNQLVTLLPYTEEDYANAE